MKKIYWFLQQLEFLGGTETVTITLCNELVKTYDVTLVVTAIEIENPPYNIDPRIKIVYLNNENSSRMDEKILNYNKEKHYLKALKIIFQNMFFVTFGKFKYRKKVLKMTDENDILIASSLDNYLIMPKKRKVIHHYHYNSKFYFAFNEKWMRLFFHKPNKIVFLDEIIYKDITKRRKSLIKKSTFIENPNKLEPKEDYEFYNNSLFFVGRFADQKDPKLLMKVFNELNKLGVEFNAKLYGSGKLLEECENYIKSVNLEKIVEFCGEKCSNDEIFSHKDLLLLTSKYEGMPLVINEANSQSIPVISTDFGDSTTRAIDENNGIVVTSRNPAVYAKTVKNLLDNKSKLLSCKKTSYRRTLKYNIKNICEKWFTIFNKM